MTRMTTAQIGPVRAKLMHKQGGRCILCEEKFSTKKKPALDHDHKTGYIRGVLCNNCNGMEGKVFNLARRCGSGAEWNWLENLLAYYYSHQTPQHGGILHPTHRTAEEKRLATNAKARKKRANLKKG